MRTAREMMDDEAAREEIYHLDALDLLLDDLMETEENSDEENVNIFLK